MPELHLSQIFIKVGGSDISTDLMNALREVVVDSSLQLPSMFTLSFSRSAVEVGG